MLTSARSEPDQNFQTSRSERRQTWARSDNRLPWNFSTRVELCIVSKNYSLIKSFIILLVFFIILLIKLLEILNSEILQTKFATTLLKIRNFLQCS